MKKIKVLHILSMVGGLEICLRQIIENIDEKKIVSCVISQPIRNKEAIKTSSKKTISHFYAPIYREINVFLDFWAVLKTIYFIKKEKPDLIHAHSSKAGVIARIAALFFNLYVIYTPHAFSFLSTKNIIKKRFYIAIEKILKNKNVRILATSESEQAHAIKKIGYKISQTKVLRNAIKYSASNIISHNFIKHKDFICTVGRPSYQKNIEMLIKVFSHLKNKHKTLHLYIVGAGEYSPNTKNVEKIIKSEGLSKHITIIPWVSREEVAGIIKRAKLYVSTSRYEGMPYSVIESLSLKKACVLTDCDGNRELIINDKTGYLIKGENIVEMSKKISELIHDKTKRLKFGAAGYKLFVKNHSFENYISNLAIYYKNISKQNRQ